MTTQTIFINESDSLDTILRENFDLGGNFPKELAFLFNKQNNNYVGYALFKQGEQHFKAFVLPKIIDNDQSSEAKIRQFVQYLAKVHSLDQADLRKSACLPLEVASLNTDGESSSQQEEVELDQFRLLKYTQLLNEIEQFFRAHRATTTRHVDYSSQSIRHRLDMRKNVTSLDKSRIHQVRKDEVIYSELAKVAYAAARLFMKQKKDLLDKFTELKQQSDSLSVFLAQKFNVPRSYSLHLQAMIGTSVSKLFTQTPAHRNVYVSILTLFGLERFWDDETAQVRFDMQGEYFFFRPEKMYELLVNEALVKEFGEGAVTKASDTCIVYQTNSIDNSIKFNTESEPDFIVKVGSGFYVIDAKWKIVNLNGKSSPFDALDLLKLERDLNVRPDNASSGQIFLVYPKIFGHHSLLNESDSFVRKSKQFEVNYAVDRTVLFSVIELAFSLH